MQRQTQHQKSKQAICFDVRSKIYTYLSYQDIYKYSRCMCKTEFGKVLKLGKFFARERQEEECIGLQVPSLREIQKHTHHLLARSWWDLVFHLAPKPALVLSAHSSELLAMSLLNRYSSFLNKTCIEFEISGELDCN